MDAVTNTHEDTHRIVRVFGPPGCGKTTYVGRQGTVAAEKYGPDSVLFASFSKAAAAELCARDLPVPKDNIGTLHAHCYRALNRPEIAETHAAEWNAQVPGDYRISNTQGNLDESAADRNAASENGDHLLAEVNRLRNKLVPRELWASGELRNFDQRWCEWKNERHYLDFTDLIETASRDCRIAPGDPRVIIGDEAQDFTALQLSLLRTWGRHADTMLICGDDDQTIYGFTGATPDAFLQVAGEKKILSQSWRIPRAIHAYSAAWIERCSEREPKVYAPRDDDGELVQAPRDWTFFKPGGAIRDAERRIAEGKSVMFLTSCNHMLYAIRASLIARGIPFHNPYRPRRGDWNPLQATRGTSAAARVAALMKPHGATPGAWTSGEFRLFAEWLRAKELLTHGSKAEIVQRADDHEVTVDDLKRWFRPDAYDDLVKTLMYGKPGELADWWLRRVLQTHVETAAYPCRVVIQRGPEALQIRPKVVIGTIHSVKGGEADVVYLFPDLSTYAYEDWRAADRRRRDTIIRLMYVGMTRARETLVLCASATNCSVHSRM